MSLRVTLPAILIIALPVAASAQTEVPNEFQAGQPARASEVNENFEVLEQAIRQLEGDTSTAAGQVLTAIPLGSEARWLVAEYFRRNSALPVDNVAAGALASLEMSNDFVTGVVISNGNVIATFGNNADAAISGGTLEFVANAGAAGVHFTCAASAEVAPHFDAESCVFVDEPPEPLATIRKQFASAIPLASDLRWLVVDVYEETGVWPVDNAQVAGEAPDVYQTSFVQYVSVYSNGEVTAVFGNSAHAQIAGGSVSFLPSDNGVGASWQCTTTLPDRYTGFASGAADCVLDADAPPQPLTRIREWVLAGLPLGEALQPFVEDFYVANGVYPGSNAEAGAPPAANISTDIVSGVSIGPGGIVSVQFQGVAPLAGEVLQLSPEFIGVGFDWECSSTIAGKYLPARCRD